MISHVEIDRASRQFAVGESCTKLCCWQDLLVITYNDEMHLYSAFLVIYRFMYDPIRLILLVLSSILIISAWSRSHVLVVI